MTTIANAVVGIACFLAGWWLNDFGRWLTAWWVRTPVHFRPENVPVAYLRSWSEERRCWVRGAALYRRNVEWCGWQEFLHAPPMELWNLAEPVPGLLLGSTYCRSTLEAAGVWVPPAPVARPIFSPKEQ